MAFVEGLTPDEAKELKKAFSLFDKNNDETICKDELPAVLRTLGQNPTQKTIDEYMKLADTDGSGNLSYDEFVQLVERDLLTPGEVEVQLRQAFHVFDKNKDGFLDKEELFQVLTSMGECLTRDEAEQILSLADTSGDGKLSADEFAQFLCQRI